MTESDRRSWYLREWRKHRGLTQQQLADLLNTTKGYVSQLESGKRNYTQRQLEALADALKCLPGDLLMRDPGDGESLWSVWSEIPDEKREDAIAVLKALAAAGRAAKRPGRKTS